MIDLTTARQVLLKTEELFEDLDGLDLSDEAAVLEQGRTTPKRANLRQERAQASKDLLLLVDRFELLAQLVKDSYWKFKGEGSAFEEDSGE
jgi:hypothetical protein